MASSSTAVSRSSTGHELGDETDALGLGRRHSAPRHHQLEGLLGRHRADQRNRDDERPEADVDLRSAELRVVGRHHQVTGQGQTHPAGQRVAADLGDRRLAQLPQRLEQLGKIAPTVVQREMVGRSGHARQIRAGTERLVARPGDHDDTHGVVIAIAATRFRGADGSSTTSTRCGARGRSSVMVATPSTTATAISLRAPRLTPSHLGTLPAAGIPPTRAARSNVSVVVGTFARIVSKGRRRDASAEPQLAAGGRGRAVVDHRGGARSAKPSRDGARSFGRGSRHRYRTGDARSRLRESRAQRSPGDG